MARRVNPLDALNHKDCCSVQRATDAGASVKLPEDSSNWLCISGTRYQAEHDYTGKLCDYLLFWQPLRRGPILLVAIELKSGSMNIRSVADQIQNGLSRADQMLENVTTKFTP